MDDLERILHDFTPGELDKVKDLLLSNDINKLRNLEKSLYRLKPPTPKEFLDTWLGDEVRGSLYPHVIEMFCDIWDIEKDYHEVNLYGATRSGKSLCSRLCIVYCIVRLWCLKSPHKYYNLSKVSSLAIYLMSFSKEKAKQLLLAPIENILKASPRFHQVLFTDRVDSTQEKLGTEKIVWTTASKIGMLEFAGNIHICVGSNPMDIIGADIIMALISEINFFVNIPGITEEDVWNVFTMTKDRIEGTIAQKYGAMIMLDSSANNRDSIIEDYILTVASKSPSVYFRSFTRWEAVPDRFPRWQKSGETFPVFIGDTNRAPCLVDESFDKKPGDEKLLIDVPIDAREAFTKDIYNSLRNIAGIPTGNEMVFFDNIELVKPMFDENMTNVQQAIEAPLSEASGDLIMRKVRDVFMKQDMDGKWILKRARYAPRWVRVDLSEGVSDRTGLAMCHPEVRDNGDILCVYDFAFDVKASKDGLNLDAVKEFIRDLYLKYYVDVVGVSSDKYQSSFIAQAIKKDNKTYKLISVDGEKVSYIVFKSKVLNNCVKVGYYLNLFNNLRSLIETTTKIDHVIVRKNIEKGVNTGYGAKDISDAQAGSCYNLYSEIGKYSIRYNYDDINRTINQMKGYVIGSKMEQIEKSHLYENLMKNVHVRRTAKPKII